MLLEDTNSVESCPFTCVKSAFTNSMQGKGEIQEAEKTKLLWGRWCVSAG